MQSESFKLRCALPTVVHLGTRQWVLALGYSDKGRRSALVAHSGDRGGELVSGRTRTVAAAIVNGFCVPAGTIRARILRTMVADGRAVIVPPEREW